VDRQQVVEAFPEDSAPRWLLRDRDSIYDDQVRRRIASLGITEVVSSPLSPWQNPYVERLIGSIRRESLDHVIILNHSISAACFARISPTTIGAARISA
jgi:putative transposase